MLKDLTGSLVPRTDIWKAGRTMVWLIRRGLTGRWRDLIAIVTANVAGVTTGASAFGLLLVYVRAQASGPETPMSGIAGLVAAHWGTGVATYALTALLLGTLSATCTYYANRGALYVARDFHASTVRDAVLRAGRNDDTSAPVQMLSPSHRARHIPGLYARHAATVLRLLLEAILPLVTSVVAVCALVYIDPVITLSLVPPATVGIVCLSILSAKGAHLLRRYQTKASEMAPLVSETFSAAGTDVDAGDECWSTSSLLSTSGVLTDTLESLYDQTLLSRQVQLTNRLLQIFSLAWLVLLFGHNPERGASAWTSILIYLIALRYAWQCLGRLSVFVVEMARFMPSVEVCAQYLAHPSRSQTTV